MKIKSTILLASFALAGLSLIQSTAKAQDLLLGFRTSNAGQPYNLMIDLGPVSGFTSASSQIILTNGDSNYNGAYAGGGLSAADLAQVIGTSGTINYGFGGTDASSTSLWMSFNATPPNSPAGLSSALHHVSDEYGSFFAGDETSAGAFSGYTFGSSQAQAYDASLTDDSSYTGAVRPTVAGTPASQDYQAFAFGSTEGTLSQSVSTSIELYAYMSGSSTPVDEGQFVMGAGGDSLVFNPNVVPEPSTLAALVGGCGLLGLIRRRRAMVA
jgi:hypothetical protein